MVTLVTILQVNLVMSILLYVMFLAYLYGIQATSSMDTRQQHQQQHQHHQPTPDPINTLIIKLLQADISRSRPKTQRRGGDAAGSPAQQGAPSSGVELGIGPPVLPDARDSPVMDLPKDDEAASSSLLLSDPPPPPPPQSLPLSRQRSSSLYQAVPDLSLELLQQHKRYNSPRVLLSNRPPMQPPPLYLMDDFVSTNEGGGGANANELGVAATNRTRKRRYAEHKSYRGEYSVCDSESKWVTDKSNAVDIRGNPVLVLGTIPSNAGRPDVKQYFYETRCRASRPFKSGCRGIDDKHWNSQCKTTQTYVRALTQDKATHDKVSVGWRWIRIDTSCVCALSRKRRRT
ncbi:neurotrophin-3 [Engraulis encrasicolus]|uniref:neurotrophin-3 n=1 Tax=Engraulis encrasicolus TaxID=184585 RepID=UPI002FD0585A